MKQLFLPILFSLLFTGCPPSTGMNDPHTEDPAPQKFLQYTNTIYEPQIRSVEFYSGDDPLSFPFNLLSDLSGFTLEFDELISWEQRESDFWISIINCDAQWNPSGLLTLEYQDGYSQDRIYDWRRAENTRIPYVHYMYKMIPDRIRITRSGNYLLKVYRDGDEEDIVITRRFIVGEKKVFIEPMLGQSYSSSQRQKLQRLDFNLQLAGLNITNPITDLQVVILQNGRWDNAATGLQPTFHTSEKLEYQFNAASKFSGGNEFRFFDVRSTRFRTNRMSEIQDRDSIYFIKLVLDQPRKQNMYLPTWDTNGSFGIGVQEYPFADYMADYVLIKFSLKYPAPLANGDAFILNRYFDWKITEENKLQYNATTLCYEAEVLMKQGVFDYQYAWMPAGVTTADEGVFEGSHFETENLYTILVYYTPIGNRTSDLIGMQGVNYKGVNGK